MKILMLVLAVATVGAIWDHERDASARLQVQIDTQRQANTEHETLERDRARLQQEAAQRIRSERERAARAPLDSGRAAAAESSSREFKALIVGEWLSPAAWTNRGQATPTDMIETTLWAAAGGDTATLQQLLLVEGAVRAKAEALLKQLSASAGARYSSPEQLIAAFTTGSIPLGQAQVVWQHQPSDEEAFACVFMKNPDNSTGATIPPPTPRGPNEAPSGAANTGTRATYLSLRRTDQGWRLVVPDYAVEKIARELGRSK